MHAKCSCNSQPNPLFLPSLSSSLSHLHLHTLIKTYLHFFPFSPYSLPPSYSPSLLSHVVAAAPPPSAPVLLPHLLLVPSPGVGSYNCCQNSPPATAISSSSPRPPATNGSKARDGRRDSSCCAGHGTFSNHHPPSSHSNPTLNAYAKTNIELPCRNF